MQHFAQHHNGIMLRNDDTIVSQINFYSFGGKEVLKYCLSLQGANMKQ